MALKTKTISANGAKGHHEFTLEVIEDSTTIADNTSQLSFTFKLSPIADAWDWYDWGQYISYSIKINGAEYTGYIPNYDGYATVTLKTGTITVEHTADGSKTIEISFSVTDKTGKNYTPGNVKEEDTKDTMELTLIPRQADITLASDFTDEQNPTIQYSNSAGNSVDKLQACISLTEDGEDIQYRDISKTGTSYTFNLTAQERNILRNLTKNVKSAAIYFIIKTVIGEATYYSVEQKTLSIVNANPIFAVGNVSYKDTNAISVGVTNNDQKIVQNKSELQVTYTPATALKGASIVNYKFVLNETTKNSTSEGGIIDFGTINSANDLVLTVIVTDSRGNETTITKKIMMLAHSNPNAIVTLQRLNNYEDKTYLTVDASISSIDTKNTMSIKYRYKVSGGTYNSFVAVEDNKQQVLSLDKNNMYIFNIVVTDAFGAQYNKEHTLGKGVFPLFIDTQRNSVGVNGFPTKSKSFEIFGDAYINGQEISKFWRYATKVLRNQRVYLGKCEKDLTNYNKGSLTVYVSNLDIYDYDCPGIIHYFKDTGARFTLFDEIRYTSAKKYLNVWTDGTYLYLFLTGGNYHDNWNVDILSSRGFSDMTGAVLSQAEYDEFVKDMTYVADYNPVDDTDKSILYSTEVEMKAGDSISLPYSVDNYKEIEIICYRGNDYGSSSVKFSPSSNKSPTLVLTYSDSTRKLELVAKFSFSGSTLTCTSSNAYTTNSSGLSISSENTFKLAKIIGYK